MALQGRSGGGSQAATCNASHGKRWCCQVLGPRVWHCRAEVVAAHRQRCALTIITRKRWCCQVLSPRDRHRWAEVVAGGCRLQPTWRTLSTLKRVSTISSCFCKRKRSSHFSWQGMRNRAGIDSLLRCAVSNCTARKFLAVPCGLSVSSDVYWWADTLYWFVAAAWCHHTMPVTGARCLCAAEPYMLTAGWFEAYH